VSSIQSGLLFGYAGLVTGIVKRMLVELAPGAEETVKVIATGGHAAAIAGECPILEAIEPDLTLDGLRRIWERNRSGKLH
jgi:type III pantothenate kinase